VPWIDDGAVVIQIGGVRGASGYRVAERDDREGARGDGGVDYSSMGFSRVLGSVHVRCYGIINILY